MLVIAVALAACAHPAPKASPSTEPDTAERERAEANLAWLESKVTALCACDGRECASAINQEVGSWTMAHFGDARLDEAQRERLRNSMTQMTTCIEASSAPAPNGADQAIAEIRAIETRMCACTDAACAKRVSAEMDDVLAEHADTQANESQIKEAGELMGRIVECQTRATTP